MIDRTEIVAWDNLTVTDWASDGLSHAYAKSPDRNTLYRVCEPVLGLGMRALAPGSRLQPHVPELPLCPRCAKIAGIWSRLNAAEG